MGKLRDFNYELFEHTPYSLDLAPSTFRSNKPSILKLKKLCSWKKCWSNEVVIRAVNGYFEVLPQSHFRDGIQLLEKRWTKYVELKGDYVEK